jgi:hypothetical protein
MSPRHLILPCTSRFVESALCRCFSEVTARNLIHACRVGVVCDVRIKGFGCVVWLVVSLFRHIRSSCFCVFCLLCLLDVLFFVFLQMRRDDWVCCCCVAFVMAMFFFCGCNSGERIKIEDAKVDWVCCVGDVDVLFCFFCGLQFAIETWRLGVFQLQLRRDDWLCFNCNWDGSIGCVALVMLMSCFVFSCN